MTDTFEWVRITRWACNLCAYETAHPETDDHDCRGIRFEEGAQFGAKLAIIDGEPSKKQGRC